MYLMYVDESGDYGMPADNSPTRFFCLSGIVVHELRWRQVMQELIRFRHWLKSRYKIFMEDELHSAEMISRPSKIATSLASLKKYERLAILRHHAEMISKISDISIINIVVDKHLGRVKSKEDVFHFAWCTIFQRFENTIQRANFPGPRNQFEHGIVFTDHSESEKLKRLLEKMRIKNLIRIPDESGSFSLNNLPIYSVIEDPIARDSAHSYFIQVADLAVYLLKQSEEPSNYMKSKGGSAYFDRLEPVLCKVASRRNSKGIVYL